MIKAYLLLILGLGWGLPQQPLFRIHCSTRHVTCLTEEVIGTSGGLRRLGTGPVEMPGLVVRGICGQTIASEAGLYQDGRCLDPRPAWSVTQTPGGLASGHAQGRVKFWATGSEVQCPTDAPIHSLVCDGHSLLAASNQGLWCIDGESVRAVKLTNNPIASTVTCLQAYPGGLLVGTAAGAYRRSGGDWAALPGGVVNVSALTVSGDGHVWVGTADQGVFEEREGGLKAVPNCPRQVTALLWTARGLMVGSDQGAFLDGKPLYDWHGEISGNHITALACCASGVWAGTFQDGLSELPDGQGWRPIEGLPSSWINQLSSCGDQVLVRFSSGLIMSGQKARSGWLWQTMGRSCGWPKDWTSGLGQGWVATLSGFYAQQKRGWKAFAPKPALQGVTVTGVALFRQQFWLASQNGVYRFDPVSGGCQQVLAELPDSWVTCLESFHGQLWTGTFRGGLCHFDGRNWSREERPGPRIHCLLATAAGLWIGTPRGLMWTDGHSWRCYDRAQGLPSNAIWSLAVRGDQLWIGTDSGLCQASLRALTQSAHEVGFDRPLSMECP